MIQKMTVSLSTIPSDYNPGYFEPLPSDENVFHTLANVAEIYVLSINLFEVTGRVLSVAVCFISHGDLVPQGLLFITAEIRRFESALKPFEGELAHAVLHETVAE